jgi:hypothetical protein
MKERMRKALGFLGLIEDEYGEYGATTPARPFTEPNPEPCANMFTILSQRNKKCTSLPELRGRGVCRLADSGTRG